MRPAIEAELSVSLEVAHLPMNGLEALSEPSPNPPEMWERRVPGRFST